MKIAKYKLDIFLYVKTNKQTNRYQDGQIHDENRRTLYTDKSSLSISRTESGEQEGTPEKPA